MLAEPQKTFGALAHHLLMTPTPEQLDRTIDDCSFDKLKAQEEADGFKERPETAERFFREGRADQWKKVLTPVQVDRIVKDHSEQMTRFGSDEYPCASPLRQVEDMTARFIAVRDSGEQVIIDRTCASARTVVLGPELCYVSAMRVPSQYRRSIGNRPQLGSVIGTVPRTPLS